MDTEDLRAFISGLYTEKMIWTKDSSKKYELMMHRNAIETNDKDFYAELLKIKRVIDKGISELETKIVKDNSKENDSWESVSK